MYISRIVEWAMVSMFVVANIFAMEPAPRIHSKSTVFNFGRKMDSDDVECVFEIENAGDLSLQIDEVRSSCGCTVASISSKLIAPGRSAQLRVDVDLNGRNGDFDKRVQIESNDPERPVYLLSIQGDVVPSRLINPRHVFFQNLAKDEKATKSVSVEFNDRAHEISSVETRSKFLKAELVELKKGRRYRIVVQALPPYPDGEVKGDVYAHGAHGELMFSVPIWVQVVSDIMYSPQAILLYPGNGDSLRRQIVIRKGSASDFRILAVEVPDKRIKASVHPLGEYGYRIQLDNIPLENHLQGLKLVIKTDLSDSGKIEIPFKFRTGD